MKKIEEQMVEAVKNRQNWEKSNTKVEVAFGNVYVYLFGNLIAWGKSHKTLKFSTCGWHTPTTRNRLNALGANCYIKNGQIKFK